MQVKQAVLSWVRNTNVEHQMPPFLRNKVAQVIVALVQVSCCTFIQIFILIFHSFAYGLIRSFVHAFVHSFFCSLSHSTKSCLLLAAGVYIPE